MSQVATQQVNAIALSESERLFATLDGVRVWNGVEEWSWRIQGIHADGPYLWVQLFHDDEDSQSVVVRLPRHATVADIVHVLEQVRFDEESSGHVVRLGIYS